jgi:hypothetical protein
MIEIRNNHSPGYFGVIHNSQTLQNFSDFETYPE